MASAADTILLLILAWLFPPAAVALVAGCGADLCINILLTFLAYLPGCIHAFWLVLRRTEANERYGQGNWTYKGMGEYVARDPARAPLSAQYQAPYGPGQPPAPPPANAPPPTQAPVQTEPKQGGDGAASAPPPQAPVDQKSGLPPPAPAYQQYDATPKTVPADQKAVQVVPQGPADQKQAEPTEKTSAPPGGF